MKRQAGAKRRKGGLFLTLLLAAFLGFPEGAFAERPTNPGGGPPEGKGRKPPEPGGTTKGDLLGDLWVVVRDVATGNGKPIYFTWEWPDTYYDESGDLVVPPDGLPIRYDDNVEGGCVQPISDIPISPAPGTAEVPQFTYEYVDTYGEFKIGYLIPLDGECAIPDVYAETWGTQVMEVDSGRLNLARTTQYVLDSAYEEALTALNEATSLALGPAGRLLIGLTDGSTRIIDSPRENLALYQRLMLDGCLSATDNLALTNTGIFESGDPAVTKFEFLLCGEEDPELSNADLQVAASFLAGAADKSGTIGTDEVVYLNSTLGINTVEQSSSDGSLYVTGYFDFGDFTYHRNANYAGVTADLLQPPALDSVDFDANGYPLYFTVEHNLLIAGPIFGTDGDGNVVDWNGTSFYPQYPIINFVRAADDSVSVINYIHNYELPVYMLGVE